MVESDPDAELSYRPSEMQLLMGHSDFVRILMRIDDRRIASAADDSTVIVWDTQTGRRLTTLTGHSQPVTCLLVVTASDGLPVLVSGSADHTIRVRHST